MPVATSALSLAEFHERYDGEKPYYEYWFGEAVQKTVPTWLHGILQLLIGELLRREGYKSSSELELRIDEDFQPKADVVGTSIGESPYPTQPFEIVVEILSPADPMSRVFEKCRQYERIGIQKTFVLDPQTKTGWEWVRTVRNLERIESMDLPNGRQILLSEVWDEIDRRK